MQRCQLHLSPIRRWASSSISAQSSTPLSTPHIVASATRTAVTTTRAAATASTVSSPTATSNGASWRAYGTGGHGSQANPADPPLPSAFGSPPHESDSSHTAGSRPYRGPAGRGRGGSWRGNRQGQSHRHRGGPMKDRYPPITTDLSDPRRRLALLVDGTNTNLLRNCTTRQEILTNSSLFTNVMAAVAAVGVPVLIRVFAHQLPPEWDPLLLPESVQQQQQQQQYQAHACGRATAPAMNDAPIRGGGGNGDAGVVVMPLSAESAASADAAATKASASAASTSGSGGVVVEYFRVERFIPIPMQIEADAQHIFDFRFQNKIEGVCYVCHEVDRALYEALMAQQDGRTLLNATGEEDFMLSLLPERAQRQSGEKASGASSSSVSFFNQYLLDELGMVSESTVDGRPGDGA